MERARGWKVGDPGELAEQVARTRSNLPPNRAHIDAREVERAAFGVVGHRDLAFQVWEDAHAAAVGAWRECRRRMRREYGGRSPHGGWTFPVLFLSLLAAGVGAALASGARTDPEATQGVLAVLVGGSTVADLVVLAVAGWRPWNRAVVRLQIGLAIALGAATAFQLSRPEMWVLPLVIAGGVIGVGGMLLVLLVRMLRPEERLEIDTVINVAVERMQPELDARVAEIRANASEELGVEDSARIVALRTAVLADLAAEGIVLEPVPEQTPAGGAMIAALTAHWHPYSRQKA
ncbi:hypothetical protein [Microbacterium galbinum]|uniref:Uncharacterized protein n=1 Tax=Microbacterium galbinum TaxID=2851646 RepID=A0ABY4IQ48_9MICO|nr:hypothetical protein [Microbacterium galbinum]UPL13745.1 hypothetical protein KV396_04345 [Microbacterium galbinum]